MLAKTKTRLVMSEVQNNHSMDIFSEHAYDVVTSTKQRPLKRND